MKSIVLILPYFGKFNEYFPLFLNSCKFNPTINWLIYTDDERQFLYPANVKVIYCSFSEFRQKLQDNFQFKILLDAPYKLCDYKPSYGEALQQDIKEYDFWGHCDCDLIFGDIRRFVTDEILSSYSKIFTRGHLTIYRNIPEINSFYRKQDKIDHKKIYTDPKSYAFDEWPGISKIWKNQGLPFYDELVMDDIWTSSINFKPTKVLTVSNGPYHDHNRDLSKQYLSMKNIVYEYDRGRIYRKWRNGLQINEEEVAYVHMQKRKMTVGLLNNEDNFLIVPNIFIPVTQLDIKNIRNISRKKMSKNDYFLASKNFAKTIRQNLINLTK